jgi:hypothetical protein
VKRRTILGGLTLGVLGLPVAAAAQQAGRQYRIGFLHIDDHFGSIRKTVGA